MKPFSFTYAPNWPWLPQISLTLTQLMPCQWELYYRSLFLWQCLKNTDPVPQGSQRNLSFGLAGPNDHTVICEPTPGKGLRLFPGGSGPPWGQWRWEGGCGFTSSAAHGLPGGGGQARQSQSSDRQAGIATEAGEARGSISQFGSHSSGPSDGSCASELTSPVSR